jgi:hypothetical protein
MTQNHSLRNTPVKCNVCGRFMRKLGLIESIRLGLLPNENRTHICVKSSIRYEDGVMEHE